MTLLDRFRSKDSRRRRALKRAAPGPLQDYLAAPLPDRRMPLNDARIVAMDFETTGLDPKQDDIISIGLVDITHGAVQLDSAWHRVIRVSRALPAESVTIHQITDDQIAQGVSLQSVLPYLLQRLQGNPILVHYRHIEQNFLDAACLHHYGAGFVASIIDTLELAQNIFERRNHTIQPGDLRLFNLRPRYNLPRYKAHNALMDAIATAELFLAMAADMVPKGNARLGDFLTN